MYVCYLKNNTGLVHQTKPIHHHLHLCHVESGTSTVATSVAVYDRHNQLTTLIAE